MPKAPIPKWGWELFGTMIGRVHEPECIGLSDERAFHPSSREFSAAQPI
jgi:hypothetical protein